jgi:hypothetical protein
MDEDAGSRSFVFDIQNLESTQFTEQGVKSSNAWIANAGCILYKDYYTRIAILLNPNPILNPASWTSLLKDQRANSTP